MPEIELNPPIIPDLITWPRLRALGFYGTIHAFARPLRLFVWTTFCILLIIIILLLVIGSIAEANVPVDLAAIRKISEYHLAHDSNLSNVVASAFVVIMLALPVIPIGRVKCIRWKLMPEFAILALCAWVIFILLFKDVFALLALLLFLCVAALIWIKHGSAIAQGEMRWATLQTTSGGRIQSKVAPEVETPSGSEATPQESAGDENDIAYRIRAIRKVAERLCPACNQSLFTSNEMPSHSCGSCGVRLFGWCKDISCGARNLIFYKNCTACGGDGPASNHSPISQVARDVHTGKRRTEKAQAWVTYVAQQKLVADAKLVEIEAKLSEIKRDIREESNPNDRQKNLENTKDDLLRQTTEWKNWLVKIKIAVKSTNKSKLVNETANCHLEKYQRSEDERLRSVSQARADVNAMFRTKPTSSNVG